jgi:hypothetical protein
LTHDEAIKKLFLEYNSADKKRYTDFFLSALSASKFNSGLYVYAVMKTFPKHSFITRSGGVDPAIYAEWTDEQKSGYHRTEPCHVCSGYRQEIGRGSWNGISEDVWDDEFYFVGGIHVNNIYKMLYVLRCVNRLEQNPCITEHDFCIFKEILLYLKNAEPDTKIRDVHKQLKKSSFYKPLGSRMKKDGIGMRDGALICVHKAEDKIKNILETLGVCGILHTEKHKAPFYEYVNLAVAPRSSHSSDWVYPVDFWRGRNGIDWEAFDYWFGEYKEFESIRE